MSRRDAAPPPRAASPQPPAQQPSRGTHEVRPGDTLGDIAARRGVSVDELLRRNPRLRGNADDIRVGDVLVVPASAREDDRRGPRRGPPLMDGFEATPNDVFAPTPSPREAAEAKAASAAYASSSGGGHPYGGGGGGHPYGGGGGGPPSRGASFSRAPPGSVDVADAAGARYDTRSAAASGGASFSDEVNHSSNASSNRRKSPVGLPKVVLPGEYLRDVGERARLAAERASGARVDDTLADLDATGASIGARTKRLGMEAAKAASATIPKVIEGGSRAAARAGGGESAGGLMNLSPA